MKVLSTDGLTKLIQLIKSAFISVDDTVTTTTVELADVATTGDYDDLINKPTIPSAVTESTVSGWGFTKNLGTVTSVNNVSPVNGNVTLSIPDTSNLANKDLSNLTTTGNAKFQAPLVSGTNIKTINSTSILGSGNISVQPTLVSGTNIKTVNGTSILGSGNITTPTANDGTLTIQLNGTTVETFSANSSSNKTANIQATQVIWRKHTTT